MKIIQEFRKSGRLYYIVDTKYGKCEIYKFDYLKGHQPTINKALNKNEYFVNKAREIHGDRYDYSKVAYNGYDNKIIIICKEHGEFLQTPHNHLNGNNCTMCGKLASSNHRITHSKGLDKAIVYCLQLEEEDGNTFYKIGFTKHSIQYRYGHFYQSKIPYDNVQILWEKTLPTEEAIKLENDYHKLLSDYHYIPKKPFAGSRTECFKII